MRSRSGSSSSTAALGKQIEDGAIGSRDRRVKLPAGKNCHPAGSNGRFDHFLVIPGDALAREPRMNRAQQADR